MDMLDLLKESVENFNSAPAIAAAEFIVTSALSNEWIQFEHLIMMALNASHSDTYIETEIEIFVQYVFGI